VRASRGLAGDMRQLREAAGKQPCPGAALALRGFPDRAAAGIGAMRQSLGVVDVIRPDGLGSAKRTHDQVETGPTRAGLG